MEFWKNKLFLSILFILMVMKLMFVSVMQDAGEGSQSWDEVQRQRRARVAEVCAKYRETRSLDINYDRFFYSPTYSLMMCSTAKAGSTTFFLTTFTQILEGEQFKLEVEPQGGQTQVFCSVSMNYFLNTQFWFVPLFQGWKNGINDRKSETISALKNRSLIRERVHHPDTVSFTVCSKCVGER